MGTAPTDQSITDRITTVTVNGARRQIATAPETPLLYALRNELGLVGTRFGCGANQCGACFVLVNGRPVPSCDTPVWSVAGDEVTTVEGLEATPDGTVLQQAFLAEQAGQCGYCLSGVLISATALLRSQPNPSEADVRDALDRNLCRCGSQQPDHPGCLTRRDGGKRRMNGSPLPVSLLMNPRISRWIELCPDGLVQLSVGKVEIGQGILTALAQIAADELEVDIGCVHVVPATTGTSPNEMFTAGSTSVEQSGQAVRLLAAEARQLLLTAGACRFGLSAGECTTQDGKVIAPDGRALGYWELAEGGLLDRDATGEVAPKPPAARRLIGTSVPRLDLPAKIKGQPSYVHDLVWPGMLHARVARPPAPGASLLSVDESVVAGVPGVRAVVRDGSFLGVLAEREEVALQAVTRLAGAARWGPGWGLPDERDWRVFLLGGPHEVTTIADRHVPQPRAGPIRTLTASYTRPFLAHGSIGPSCAVARWIDGRLAVWCSGQGIENLRSALAPSLGVVPEAVTVHHVEGAGAYGHNGADDVAYEAALLAREVPGTPVRLVWSREEELGWAPFGAAGLVELTATFDDSGSVLAWEHHFWSNGHISRPGVIDDAPAFVTASQLAEPFDRVIAYDLHPDNGGGRNATPLYVFPSLKVVGHRLLDMPIRTSSLRSLGAYLNVFAIESFMDELAEQAGLDPIDFRLQYLDDQRARRVLEVARELRGTSPTRDAVGRGVGFARYKNVGGYCAVVAEVEAVETVLVPRLWVVADVGTAVNPDGVANQLEGGAVQATSWTLREQVRFDQERVISTTWETYPILRFSEVPCVSVHLIDNPAEPPLGVGEIVQGPVAAAIGNGLAAALGVRIRDLPLTRERLLDAIDS
jgi:nicotinate dehydrogenase subunit B